MSMTPEEAIKILEAKSKCMKREFSGTDFDCNFHNCYKCDLNYEQGTIGDQIKALDTAISALQAQDLQPTCNNLATDTISEQSSCVYCHEDSDGYVTPIEKNCHAFIRFGMEGWELSLKANGWHGSAKIKYCPMCGRKLKNDK